MGIVQTNSDLGVRLLRVRIRDVMVVRSVIEVSGNFLDFWVELKYNINGSR